MTRMVKEMAESSMATLKRQDMMFVNAGVDTKDTRSTRGMKTTFTAIKDRTKKIGDVGRIHNMLLDELSDLFGVQKIQMASAVHSLFNGAKVKVRGLSTNDDLCDEFDNIRCNSSAKYRTTDGSCNNLRKPMWGRAFIPMRRFQAAEYEDGVSTPRTKARGGGPLPSSRAISLAVHSTDDGVAKEGDVAHMLMQWGQFLDHDITSTPVQSGADGFSPGCCMEDVNRHGKSQIDMDPEDRDICFPIRLPPNDPKFHPKRCMNFVRSVQTSNTNCTEAPVEQINQITAYIDASGVYGSSDEDFEDLREFSGGRLRSSRENLLPEDDQLTCLKSKNTDFCFRAGDGRVNEQMALAALHTVWMREHNRMARELGQLNPAWDDEMLFQETRRIVGAKIQHITYTEFLPVVLSKEYRNRFDLTSAERGHQNLYDDSIDASIRNSFASAAYRFGHSLIRTMFSQFGANFRNEPELQLKWSFGNTSLLIDKHGDGVNKYLRGLVTDAAGSADGFMTPEVTQHLFEDAGGHSLDLAALNIQRGRDHGLPSYNQWRKWCSLPEAQRFRRGPDGFVHHRDEIIRRLESIYRHPDDVDLFAGGLSETRTAGGLVGPTFACILAHQFKALKVGDRFWYERDDPVIGFTTDQLDSIKKTTLAKVICDNTAIEFMQPSAFGTVTIRNMRKPCRDLARQSLTAWRDNPTVRKMNTGDDNARGNTGNRDDDDNDDNNNNQENRTQDGNTGVIATWTAWSPCRGSSRFRMRRCLSGSTCKAFQKGRCRSSSTLSKWSTWGTCSGRTQSRRRSCRVENRSCTGRHSQVRLCNKSSRKDRTFGVVDENRDVGVSAFEDSNVNGGIVRGNSDGRDGDRGKGRDDSATEISDSDKDKGFRVSGDNRDELHTDIDMNNRNDGQNEFGGENDRDIRFDGSNKNGRFDKFGRDNDGNNGFDDGNSDGRFDKFGRDNDGNNGFDDGNSDGRFDKFGRDNDGNNGFDDGNSDGRFDKFGRDNDGNNGFGGSNRDGNVDEFGTDNDRTIGVSGNRDDRSSEINNEFDISNGIINGFDGNNRDTKHTGFDSRRGRFGIHNDDTGQSVHASWGPWGPWGGCEVDTSVRRRDCSSVQPPCIGTPVETMVCALPNFSFCKRKKVTWLFNRYICR